LLSGFLAGSKDKPIKQIHDYFSSVGIDDFESADADLLHDHFRILICGFLYEELFRKRQIEEPQPELLKKRAKAIINSAAYFTFSGGPRGAKMIALASNSDDLRQDSQPLPDETLRAIIQEAFNASTKRTVWCRKILEAIDQEKSYQNFVTLNDLLRVMVSVNATAVDEMLCCPVTESPKGAYVSAEDIEHAIDHTIVWARNGVLAQFVSKGTVSAQNAVLYLKAARAFLRDLAFCGDTDLIPRYLKEVLPPGEDGDYRRHHKYPFETLVKNSVAHFRDLLRK
jgi:hypothetical protein